MMSKRLYTAAAVLMSELESGAAEGRHSSLSAATSAVSFYAQLAGQLSAAALSR